MNVYVFKLVALSCANQDDPDFVAAATVAKSSLALVRKPDTGQTVPGKDKVRVESVVLGFIRMRL